MSEGFTRAPNREIGETTRQQLNGHSKFGWIVTNTKTTNIARARAE